MEGNYLLWLMLYVTASFVIATSVYRANLNIRRRIEADLVEDERSRMRGEMQEGLAQNLINLSTKIESVGELIGAERSSEAQALLREVRALAKDSFSKTRESIDQLAVEPLPLVPALEENVGEFGERSGVQAHFEADSVTSVLPPAAEVQLLRIVQEALANVERHAGAANAWVTLGSTRDAVHLTVRDDGRGLTSDVNEGKDAGRRGVQGMRERAEGLGGTLHITSAAGEGTEVRVSVPRGRYWR